MKAVIVVLVAGVVLGCPHKIGIAINTGDVEESIGRVRYSLGYDGWAKPENFRAANTEADIAVYSSIRSGWMPWGSTDADGNAERCVPVIPCCGGRDLGKTIASAQQMREHTWKHMLDDFSKDTEWFVSTEDDAWFNVTRLCGIIDNFKTMDGGDDPSNAMIVSVGRFTYEEWGAFVVFNRAVLKLLGEQKSLDRCRLDLLKPRNAKDAERIFRGKYEGADYNLDQLLGYCLFNYFPKVTKDIKFVVQYFYPLIWGRHRPNKFWYNSASGWDESHRAPELLELMTPQERQEFVGVHHVKVDDMAYLESRTLTSKPAQPATHCGAWINPSNGHARDNLPIDNSDIY